MKEEASSAPSRTQSAAVQKVALVLMAMGFMAFLYGLGRGIAIDPRFDMHGRMVAYTIGIGGLTAALACQYVLAKHRLVSVLYAGFTAMSAVLLIYQFTKIF